MKTLLSTAFLTVLLATTLFSQNTYANKKVFADVQLNKIQPQQSLWRNKVGQKILYPIEFARAHLKGCAVVSFDISVAGKVKNIKVINTSSKKLAKATTKLVKKWRWQLANKTATAQQEQRLLRFDFCLGDISQAETEQFCKQQVLHTCS
ncbi:MAG: energy transducer TonB [Gammaproteobacteria bacterium]|nr:MAG: energy transducer TonB [Gammaproteobacteria bacterium]